MFRHRGQPVNLDEHFAFEPVFSTHHPHEVTLRAARQVAKTFSLTMLVVVKSLFRSHHRTLVVCPLQEQSDRLSNLYFRPLMEDSPFRSAMFDGADVGSVRLRVLTNRALIHFGYAYLSAERLRSISVDDIWLDEAQDMDTDHYPLIKECQSATKLPFRMFSGSSKTRGTLLESRYDKSSQGRFHIKCGCGFENICAAPPIGHLEDMIGDYHPDISEARPGVKCASPKCGRPISPRGGRWVHHFRERTAESAGLHIPQVIMPNHYALPNKWKELIGKRHSYPKYKFYNEVFGEPYDTDVRLFGVDLMKAVGNLGPNSLAQFAAVRNRYRAVTIGIDWGGGGVEGDSRTKVAIAALAPDGRVHVPFGKEYPAGENHFGEAADIANIITAARPDWVAHDYNGAGAVRESLLINAGWPLNRIVPYVYSYNQGGRVVAYDAAPVPGKPTTGKQRQTRGFYHLDKGRSLQFLAGAMRQQAVRFFDYDHVDSDRPGLLHDFIALVSEKQDRPGGADVYHVYRNKAAGSDDFAHAANMAVWTVWETTKSWPRLLAPVDVAVGVN
jgi:hypothetical protein